MNEAAQHAAAAAIFEAYEERGSLTEAERAMKPADLAAARAIAAMEAAAQAEQEADSWEWAVVEIFGHRRHAGRVREEERFGAKLLRIDVPMKGDPAAHGWLTHYYGGSSIFSFTPCEREAALRANKPYEAPARLALSHRDDLDVADDEDGDNPIPF
ncbi:hypothetical protein VQ02_33485 [Methylobacterium variabile]|uniref:Uncharacterized protein n=1 Tax=Methylobacterium variabile TaxID=298794 RepID=A0A0J6S0W4_9HYPH|nr:hypothetical protein [Methylobacterium variabile]KMO27264.1 hypothetical protein VQ02_33485 [Methylobacterium variabile]